MGRIGLQGGCQRPVQVSRQPSLCTSAKSGSAAVQVSVAKAMSKIDRAAQPWQNCCSSAIVGWLHLASLPKQSRIAPRSDGAERQQCSLITALARKYVSRRSASSLICAGAQRATCRGLFPIPACCTAHAHQAVQKLSPQTARCLGAPGMRRTVCSGLSCGIKV